MDALSDQCHGGFHIGFHRFRAFHVRECSRQDRLQFVGGNLRIAFHPLPIFAEPVSAADLAGVEFENDHQPAAIRQPYFAELGCEAVCRGEDQLALQDHIELVAIADLQIADQPGDVFLRFGVAGKHAEFIGQAVGRPQRDVLPGKELGARASRPDPQEQTDEGKASHRVSIIFPARADNQEKTVLRRDFTLP